MGSAPPENAVSLRRTHCISRRSMLGRGMVVGSSVLRVTWSDFGFTLTSEKLYV